MAVGAASAQAEAAAPHRAGATTSWLWEIPSIGRLGPLGTSNSLYSVALNGGTSVGTARGTSSAKGSAGASSGASEPGESKHGLTYAIVGGSAIGLGVFIAAISSGSNDALTSPDNNGDNGSPFTPGGETPGTGNPGGTGTPGGVNTDTGGPNEGGGSVGGPTTVTPEPASMALLASGLAGMGGLQFRRNRKRSTEK